MYLHAGFYLSCYTILILFFGICLYADFIFHKTLFMVTLNNTQLSNIFFNFQNENIEALFSTSRTNKTTPTQNEILHAISLDAEVFSNLLNGQVPPDILIEYYMQRL